MKISVITVVYNRAATIGQAIESVQKQTYPHVEHIVQDGGSTDGTLEVIEGLAAENMQLESAPDKGVYDAINKGITRATGDVIGLMHSDDYFAHEDVLAKVAAQMTATGADGLYGDLDYVSAQNTDRIVRHWSSGDFSQAKLRQGWMPPHPTLYLKKEVFDAFGLYDLNFKIAGDYEAMLRYLISGKLQLTYLPEVMVKMRTGGLSNGSLRYILRKSREDLQAMRRHKVGGLGTLIMKNLRKVGQLGGSGGET